MSTLFAITLAAAATVQPSCSWDRPGANPYTGKTDAAIDRYTDIPERTRVKLKHRITYGNPDETVNITRDAITGKYVYDAEIRDMHFGAASVCHTVTRSKWAASRNEPGAVYCVDQHCILVPKICGNVSRIVRPRPAVAQLPPPAAATPPNWNEHVGDSDLGLLDAPIVEDVPNLRHRQRRRSRNARSTARAASPAARPRPTSRSSRVAACVRSRPRRRA